MNPGETSKANRGTVMANLPHSLAAILAGHALAP